MLDANAAGQSCLYTCFNRSLADHIARLAPARCLVSNYHELCIDHYRRSVGEPDFSDGKIFGEASRGYLEASGGFPAKYDLVIIDEAQDFELEWLASLTPQLKDGGRLYVLQDEDQRIYGREEFDLPEAVVVRCQDNFRSPRSICQVLNAFRLSSRPVLPCSPFHGEFPDMHMYANEAECTRHTVKAVEDLIAKGYAVGDIAVLSGHGLAKSRVLAEDTLGRFSLRRFTGKYDRNGTAKWTEGELLADSVYRFKGQSRPAIVLTEFDFEELTDVERRKLFVGFTRARMAVVLVIATHSSELFARQLEVGGMSGTDIL